MTAMARRVQAARGHLARLVVVLAVLAGLGLAVGLQCTDGMAMSMAHGATSASTGMGCGSPVAMTAGHVGEPVTPAGAGQLSSACAAAGAVALADEDAPGSRGLGGVLATCLAFLVAVMAAVAALRPGHLRSVVRILRTARAVVNRAFRPRALSLAELCLLRT